MIRVICEGVMIRVVCEGVIVDEREGYCADLCPVGGMK